MMETFITLLPFIVSMLGGSGITAIITSIAGRDKDKQSINDKSIETAISIQNTTLENYKLLDAKLLQCRQVLDEVQQELNTERAYSIYLSSQLVANNLNFMSKEEYKQALRITIKEAPQEQEQN